MSLLSQWHDASRFVDRSLAEALARLELTESAGAALWALDPVAPPPTVRDFARMLGCDPSNASLVSAKLVTDGLVERRPPATDGRARVLILTAQGRHVREHLVADLAALTPLRHLDTAQQRQLSRLLDTMMSA